MIYENIFTVRRYMLVRYMAPSCVCVCVCVRVCYTPVLYQNGYT